MDENKYGCTLNNPVRLSMVADEYYLLEKMHHLKGGTIIDVQRIGTQWNAETEHIVGFSKNENKGNRVKSCFVFNSQANLLN